MRKSTPPLALRKKLSTLAARGVRAEPPPESNGRPGSEPIYQSSVYEFPDVAACDAAIQQGKPYLYARLGHPNGETLSQSVAALEGAEAGVATATGTAAVLVAALSSTKPGDTILCQRDVYGGSRVMLERDLADFGRRVELVDAYDPAKVSDGLSRGARFVFVESLSNPLMREVDLPALAWHCRSSGAVLCVDNTLATPIFQRPIGHGAHLTLHSATKFLGGHHDCTAGVLVGSHASIGQAKGIVARLGLSAAPFECWLVARGLRTLPLRVERAEQTARLLAERLRDQRTVKRVCYPGWGALLSFDLGTRQAVERFVRACPGVPVAPSFGGAESTLSHPATTSNRGLTDEQRVQLGIGEGLLRLSVGIEDPDDLWSELLQALTRS